MVAYNFQTQFVAPIQAGAKRQTIRRRGMRRHARRGDLLQLYTGQRTKHCRKILDADPKCVDVYLVTILVTEDTITDVFVDGHRVGSLEQFARRDGFPDLAAMHEFWMRSHDVGPFSGVLIEWRAA